MSTLKIKVGTLVLTEARDEDLPQEFAAWHQTVRVEPGTYDVFAYLDWSDGGYRIRSLSAQCEGVTVSSNFRPHVLGTWGKSDNNRNGQRATARVHLPTYGTVDAPPSILARVQPPPGRDREHDAQDALRALSEGADPEHAVRGGHAALHLP